MLQIAFIVAVVVLLFHACTWEGMIFYFINTTLHKLPDYLKKPLYDCPICATVWWGPAVVACGILGHAWSVTNVWQLSIIVAAAAGINTILIYIINPGKAIATALTNDYDCSCSKKEVRDEDPVLNRRKRIESLGTAL